MNYNWNWGIFWQPAPDGVGTYMSWLIAGLGWTLGTALLAWVIALGIGSILGVIRTTPVKGAVRLGNAYVELFRNIPLLVQMFLWFFVFPELVPTAIGDTIKQMPPPWAAFVPAVLCLGFYTAARVAEQVRAGIQSLPRGQNMAGTALGLNVPQAYRYVLLPQAYRIIMPPLTSEFLNIIKNSSVAFAVSIAEMTMFAMQAQEETSRGIEIYLAVTGLYIVSAFSVNRVMAFIEARVRVPGYIGGGK